MIPVERLAEPEVLAKNKERWLAAFLEQRAKNPALRPKSSQYAHEQVVGTLQAMSYHKCFYCEQSTKPTKSEVDHHVEVTERPELAFAWTNLYLSCWDCNHAKKPNRSVPIGDCLDPCDPAVRPSEDLDFENEMIRARGGSPKGLKTIQKYGLDREELDLKRSRQLRLFHEAIMAIQGRMIESGRRTMTDEERELLRRFAQPDSPFSLMISSHLARHGHLEPRGP